MRPMLATALIACTASSALAQGTAEQRVELSNFEFNPRGIHLHAGQRYTLVISNLASGGHDFTAPEFFAAARIDPSDAALVEDGEIEVPGQSSRTIHLVPATGTYKLTCTHFGHSMLGMKGSIVVD